ncbi:hypothetical protein [Serratia ureilytica]|uniref:hypothetical protein n=1 Tax=Serratia ureilytica TaxID=300181 RepID=UPI002362CAC8|nr:hypothetical protein [Serratia ureilytica]
MRAVIFQGQYGIFEKEGLDLSMPAVQTCLGLYAESKRYVVCAHFDTSLNLQGNLLAIKKSLEDKGLEMSDMTWHVFGGDGVLSYLRCGKPSSFIGKMIVEFIKSQGGDAIYSNEHYSGLIEKTFNFNYINGSGGEITEGQHMDDFKGYHPEAYSISRNRIRIRPEEYTEKHSVMMDVSRFYPSTRSIVRDEDKMDEDSWQTSSVVKKRNTSVKQSIIR